MSFNNRCKICKSGIASDLEFCRFYLGWDYPKLIQFFSESLDNLNLYNCSNHLNRHTQAEVRKLFQSLRTSENFVKDKEFLGKDKEKIHRATELILREHALS